MDEGVSGTFCSNDRPSSGCDVSGNGGTKCGRWNPTSEQVKVLTELFGSGLRTPSTDQIRKISTQLSFYGKIESKNVFYWFQNHKARERQKRRKVSTQHENYGNGNAPTFPSKQSKEVKDDAVGNAFWAHKDEKETLQLFPLCSPDDSSESEKNAAHAYGFQSEMDHPPLDLRLSFL